MKAEILKIVSRIKENLKLVDDGGVYHKLLDEIFDDVEQIEEVIYDDDIRDGYGFDSDGYD